MVAVEGAEAVAAGGVREWAVVVSVAAVAWRARRLPSAVRHRLAVPLRGRRAAAALALEAQLAPAPLGQEERVLPPGPPPASLRVRGLGLSTCREGARTPD